MSVSLVKPWTVAIYVIDQAYGGPEEGGWYYGTGELHSTESPFASEREAQERATELRRSEFPDKGYRYSVRPRGEDYAVTVEHCAADAVLKGWPTVRPFYS